MHRPLFLALALALLASLALAGAPLAAEERTTPARLHLRRAVFDPLEKAPAASALGAAPGLALVQLSAPPADTTRAALAAAGLRPLWYIPDNAFLVRMPEGAAPRAKGLPGLRWLGTFDITYKYPAELDALVASNARHAVELQIVAAPDADPTALARELVGRGGTLLDRASGLNGAVLRVVLPAAALRDVVKRGDVLWVEPYRAPQALADRARGILGVPAAQTELGLTGAGQIIALTDTGLDTQEALSADFAGRVARGFSRQEMYGWCEFLSAAQQPGTWSDLHGHGTHVAGMAAGSGALSGGQLAGVAPAARLVVQAVSSGGRTLDCLPAAATYLQLAYDAGARVHNGSFGRVTGTGSCEYGCYTAEDATVDDFLWRHPDYLFVVAAGNSGRDASAPFGVVDPDSINSPATAKNVLTVGASENDRAGLGGCDSGVPERACWQVYGFGAQPLFDDLISDNPAGIAAFSSRGPTDDGRIKPEIVAPGTNIVSTRSHEPAASYAHPVGQDYAYLSGTSMATPQVSGLAALARQWLAQRRLHATPSAALLKALLLNGAASVRPGQYATADEIPSAWPNEVEGWGRATIGDTVGLGGDDRVWLKEHSGLLGGQAEEYALHVSAGEPLRVTLAWTDYPGAPGAAKALVNDLDLQVIAPGGAVLLGNADANLPDGCRSSGADRCNNAEVVELRAPYSGIYTVRVYGASVPEGPQPFALAARGTRILDMSLAAPALPPITGDGPAIALQWDAVPGATYYRVQVSPSRGFTSDVSAEVVTAPQLSTVLDPGTYYVRVGACSASGCGEYGVAQVVTVSVVPERAFLPEVWGP